MLQNFVVNATRKQPSNALSMQKHKAAEYTTARYRTYNTPLRNHMCTMSEVEKRKRRIMHQSKQRGMLENDLLLGSFAAKHMASLHDPLLAQFESLLQQPDIDIFRWITGKTEVPPPFNNTIMTMLKEHTKSNPLNYQSDTEESS